MKLSTINPEKFRSDIRNFRIALIVLTLFHIGFLGGILIGGFTYIVKNNILDGRIIALWIGTIILGGLIITIFQLVFSYRLKAYERKNMAITQKKKNDSFTMSIFIGIIGLWLWLPNKREVDEIIEKTTHNKMQY